MRLLSARQAVTIGRSQRCRRRCVMRPPHAAPRNGSGNGRGFGARDPPTVISAGEPDSTGTKALFRKSASQFLYQKRDSHRLQPEECPVPTLFGPLMLTTSPDRRATGLRLPPSEDGEMGEGVGKRLPQSTYQLPQPHHHRHPHHQLHHPPTRGFLLCSTYFQAGLGSLKKGWKGAIG